MLLVVFLLLLFNESIMYWHILYMKIYIQEYYEVYTSVTCGHFIVGT